MLDDITYVTRKNCAITMTDCFSFHREFLWSASAKMKIYHCDKDIIIEHVRFANCDYYKYGIYLTVNYLKRVASHCDNTE